MDFPEALDRGLDELSDREPRSGWARQFRMERQDGPVFRGLRRAPRGTSGSAIDNRRAAYGIHLFRYRISRHDSSRNRASTENAVQSWHCRHQAVVPWRMTPRLAAVLALATALTAACGSQPKQLIDLSCDRIAFDSAAPPARVRLAEGTQLDASLLAGNRGRLVIRAHDLADSSALSAPLGVWLDRTVRRDSVLEATAGAHALRVTCLGCNSADTSVAVRPGRTDTVHAYLVRFPSICDTGRGD